MVLLVNVYTCFNQLLYGVLLGLSTSPPYSSLALSPPESQTSRGMYVFPGTDGKCPYITQLMAI